MDGPSITIVLPTHDRAHLLPRAVRSVLAQSDGNFSLIVVDDGSCDDTAAALAPFSVDPRLRVLVNAAAMGVSAARNRAIREAGSEWIAFLDDDDEMLPTYLERLRALIAARPTLGLAWSGAEREFHGGEPRREVLSWDVQWDGVEPSSHDFLLQFSLCWGVAARRDALLAAGLFDERFIGTGDIDLAMRLVANGVPYANMPEPLVRVHIGEGLSLSRARDHRSRLRQLLLEKNAEFLAAHPRLQTHYRRFTMSGCYRDGDRAGARRQAAALLRSGHIGGRGLELVLRYEAIEPLKRLFRGGR